MIRLTLYMAKVRNFNLRDKEINPQNLREEKLQYSLHQNPIEEEFAVRNSTASCAAFVLL